MLAKAHFEKSAAAGNVGSMRPLPLHGMITVDSRITYVAGQGGTTCWVAPQQWPHHWQVPGGGGGTCGKGWCGEPPAAHASSTAAAAAATAACGLPIKR